MTRQAEQESWEEFKARYDEHIEEMRQDIRICECCEREVPRIDMLQTRDCHGIPFRWVCEKCYNKLMVKGYDGQYYDEFDECIDYEY